MKRSIAFAAFVLERAEAMLEDIRSRSPQGAARTGQELEAAVDQLADPAYPDRLCLIEGLPDDLCRVNFGRERQFCILYVVRQSQVTILLIGRAEQVHEGLRLEESE